MTELLARGVEVVRVTFRCAVCNDRIARTLDTFDPELTSKNWIYVILNESEQRVRDELQKAQPSHVSLFQHNPQVLESNSPTLIDRGSSANKLRQSTPSTGKIFVCNARPHGISVSGPPSRIQRLFEEVPFFRQSNFLRMPCYGGPIHSDHIFDEEHVSSIVKDSHSNYPPQAQVISPGTGQPFTATNATELFRQIVKYLLTEEVCWEKAVKFAAEWAKSHGAGHHRMYAFRTAQQVQDVIVAIEAATENQSVSTVDMMAWLFAAPEPNVRSSGSLQSKIAIVGMACRFPGGANDIDLYWDLLQSGRDVHEKVPADRFDIEAHYDPTGQKTNATHTPYGCFVENPGLFDPAFFNMSPREAEQTDPMQRLALVTAWEALEKAGFVAHKSFDMHRVGTFFGQSSDDYREVNSAQDIGTYWISGGCRAFGPGRINYFCGFGGPSFSCDTACSSSLATIQMACTSLWAGETDMVVAGGMNILTNPDGFAGLSKGFFLSNTGNCKTWDSEADGYCRADGVGAVVMKRLEDALADNDNILAVVGAAATNHSAEAISITHPHSGAQSHLFRQVASRAGVDPLDVGYVELHGTGTQAGDSNELESVTDVFAPAKQGRNSKQPLFIGAAKANVGHGEAAAGIISLVKTLLVLQNELIPPHVGIKNNLTPFYPSDASERNLHIPYSATIWRRSPERKRIAIVNNFGAAGGNTTFVLEEGPEPHITGTDPRSTHVLTISAKNAVSLQQNIERLIAYLEKNPEVALHDLAYTLTARRTQHPYRVGFAVSELTGLQELCEPYLAADSSIKAVRSHQPPVAFAFTGQGSFYFPMASQLFNDSPPFRTHILDFDGLARRQGFGSFLPVIKGPVPSGHKFPLVITHLAIACVEMALSDFWEDLGVKPSIVIGHSIGEVAALYAAKVLSASDAVFLVGQRARLLEYLTEAGAYGMMAVRASSQTLSKSIEASGCEIACINGPEDTVLAGRIEDLSSAAERLRADGHKTLPLDLSHGYHSQQMDCILDEYERVAQGIVFHKPAIPVISPLLSRVVEDRDTLNASYMRRATRETVDFMGALRAAQDSKAISEKTVWLELGPHPLCIGFVRNSIEKAGLSQPSLRKGEDNWSSLSQTLRELHCAGIEIDWREYHRPFKGALKLVDLPNYAWNNKNFWIPYLGDWALLKGNQPTAARPAEIIEDPTPKLPAELRTSSIHGLVEETYEEEFAKLVVETDILDPNILEAVNGHAMNGCGVVSCVSDTGPTSMLAISYTDSVADGSWRDCVHDGQIPLQETQGRSDQRQLEPPELRISRATSSAQVYGPTTVDAYRRYSSSGVQHYRLPVVQRRVRPLVLLCKHHVRKRRCLDGRLVSQHASGDIPHRVPAGKSRSRPRQQGLPRARLPPLRQSRRLVRGLSGDADGVSGPHGSLCRGHAVKQRYGGVVHSALAHGESRRTVGVHPQLQPCY